MTNQDYIVPTLRKKDRDGAAKIGNEAEFAIHRQACQHHCGSGTLAVVGWQSLCGSPQSAACCGTREQKRFSHSRSVIT